MADSSEFSQKRSDDGKDTETGAAGKESDEVSPPLISKDTGDQGLCFVVILTCYSFHFHVRVREEVKETFIFISHRLMKTECENTVKHEVRFNVNENIFELFANYTNKFLLFFISLQLIKS